MQDRALANPKITFVWDSEVAEILGSDKVTGLRITNTKDGAERVLPVSGVFVAIGHDPRSDLFDGQLAADPDGYLLVDQPSTRDRHRGRVRLRRRGGPDLPAGGDRGWDGLRGRHRRRALAGRPRRLLTCSTQHRTASERDVIASGRDQGRDGPDLRDRGPEQRRAGPGSGTGGGHGADPEGRDHGGVHNKAGEPRVTSPPGAGTTCDRGGLGGTGVERPDATQEAR